jgi:hypothetical protein
VAELASGHKQGVMALVSRNADELLRILNLDDVACATSPELFRQSITIVDILL